MTAKRMLMTALAASVLTFLVAMVMVPLRAEAAGEPRMVVRYATLAPGAFHVSDDDTDYINVGDELGLQGPSTTGVFLAPLFFEDSRVRLTNLVLYAYDNGPGAVCLNMVRTTPANGGTAEDHMGQVCSTGASDGIREFQISSWNYPFVYGAHGPYLYLVMPGTIADGYLFYGAKVTYTYEP